MLARDKHDSLLRKYVNYDRKKLYNTVTRSDHKRRADWEHSSTSLTWKVWQAQKNQVQKSLNFFFLVCHVQTK